MVTDSYHTLFLLLLLTLYRLTSAEPWRDFVLSEEACVEDSRGRLAECDFEGFSNESLQRLLKEVLESNSLNNRKEDIVPSSDETSTPKETKVVEMRKKPHISTERSEDLDKCAKIVDGMDVVVPNSGIRMVFGTPIFVGSLPKSESMNMKLSNLLYDLEKIQGTSGGHRKSAKGNGFRTDDTFLQSQTPVVKELYQHLMRFSSHVWQFGRNQHFEKARLELRGWANIMRKGAHHTIHIHPGAVWSGVYYVKIPPGTGELNRGFTDRSQGCLVMMDPRHAIQMTTVNNDDTQFVDKMEVCPSSGMIVMFPAWLSHYVPYLELDSDRIAISFNVHAVSLV